MADTTTLTAGQITTLAAAGTTRTVVAAVTKTVAVRDTSMRFYFPDAGAPLPGLRVEIRNQEFQEDVRLADISGAGSANAITTAERNALVAILEKLHVGRVHP